MISSFSNNRYYNFGVYAIFYYNTKSHLYVYVHNVPILGAEGEIYVDIEVLLFQPYNLYLIPTLPVYSWQISITTWVFMVLQSWVEAVWWQ